MVLRNVVPRDVVDAARGLINESLGKGINKKDYHQRLKPDGTSVVDYCPELHRHPAMLDVFARSGAPAILESVLGRGRLHMPQSAQVALVYPNAYKHLAGGGRHPSTYWNAQFCSDHRVWHIDGVEKAQPDQVHSVWNFSVLFGIYLSKIDEFAGNFTVFPGSHRQLEAAFNAPGGLDSLLLDGTPKIPVADPHLITTNPGDVVVAHYQTAHAVAPNLSPDVRYAMYFRVFSNTREQWSWRTWTGLDIYFLSMMCKCYFFIRHPILPRP